MGSLFFPRPRTRCTAFNSDARTVMAGWSSKRKRQSSWTVYPQILPDWNSCCVVIRARCILTVARWMAVNVVMFVVNIVCVQSVPLCKNNSCVQQLINTCWIFFYNFFTLSLPSNSPYLSLQKVLWHLNFNGVNTDSLCTTSNANFKSLRNDGYGWCVWFSLPVVVD